MARAKSGKALGRRFAGAGCGARNGGACARADRLWGRLVWHAWRTLRRLLVLLDLHVEEVADRFVVNAAHHVFEQDERFLFKLDEGIFLTVASEPDSFF